MGFLVDTCIWIEVERGRLSPGDVHAFTGDAPVYLSPVTIAELRFGAEMAKDAGFRQKRLAAVARLMRKPILRIDERTAEVFGALAAQLKQSGRGHQFRVQDLWLSAQAIQHGFRLLTQNVRDFDDVPGLDVCVLPKG